MRLPGFAFVALLIVVLHFRFLSLAGRFGGTACGNEKVDRKSKPVSSPALNFFYTFVLYTRPVHRVLHSPLNSRATAFFTDGPNID